MSFPYSTEFTRRRERLDHVDLFYYHGGDGRPVLLLHGHTQSADLWAPLAIRLAKQGFQVIAPDLHGLGRSSVPKSGYDKKSMAVDFRCLVDALGLTDSRIDVVGHDLGVFAAYAYASQYRESIDHLVLMEAVVPGVGIWPTLLQQPRTWHFGFYGEHAERLIEGRERRYLDRFWDEFAANPAAISPTMRERYTAHYKRPSGVYGALAHFAACEQDVADNQIFARSALEFPVLGIGGSASLGTLVGEHVAELSVHPTGAVIEGAGHWLLEEKPDQTIDVVTHFLATAPVEQGSEARQGNHTAYRDL